MDAIGRKYAVESRLVTDASDLSVDAWKGGIEAKKSSLGLSWAV